MNSQELVAGVREHALDHYNEDGWDYVVESFSDVDILDAENFNDGRKVGDAETVADAIATIAPLLRLLNERRRAVVAEIF